MGEYMYGAGIFGRLSSLPGGAPAAVGVYENQPRPSATNRHEIWLAFAVLRCVCFLMLMAGFDVMSPTRSKSIKRDYQYQSGEAKR